MSTTALSRAVASGWLVAAVAGVGAGAALGQCGVILQDDALPSDGFGHRTLFEWDFDGPGPLPPELLVGTDGGRVMAFDGVRWRQVGPRLSGPAWGTTATDPVAFEFLNFRGELHVVAAGAISNTPGALFRWTGSAWAQIPMTQSGCSGTGASGWMVGGTVWNDRIVVVGQNLRCGSTNALALGWDGAAWSIVGDLFTINHASAVLGAAHTTSDGRLFIGGSMQMSSGFALIAELVGSAWTARATGFGSSGIPVLKFQELDGEFFAHTSRITLPGDDNRPIAVLRENPETRSWERWFSIDDHPNFFDTGSQLLRVGDRWFLAASVGTVGGAVLTRTGDGPWQRTSLSVGLPSRMRGVTLYQNRIWAIGSTVTGAQCGRIATAFSSPVADGMAFTTEPSRFAVSPLTIPQSIGQIAVTPAGIFAWASPESSNVSLNQVPTVGVSPSNPCPTASAQNLRFDGRDWISAALPLNGIRSIVNDNGDTVAFGSFNSVGGGPITTGVARWTGTQWVSHLGNLTLNVVSATLFQGEFYASELSGSNTLVRRWNGAAWQQVGALFPGAGARLVVVADTLLAFVGGGLHVHRLENGAWVRLPDPPGNVLDAIDAAGQLTVAVSGSSNTPVWRFDGTAWQPNPAFPASVSVRTLAWHDGALYAGLMWSFTSQPTAPLMKLNGANWVRAISTANPRSGYNHPNSSVNDMFSDRRTLHLAGQFSYLGGQTVESWARFYSGAPRLLAPSPAVSVPSCDSAYLSYEPEVYHDATQTYQWSRDGQPIADGPSGTGSVISGSTTPYLRIINPGDADEGDYALTIVNGCGSTTTDAAALMIEPCVPCPADFNQDGGVDGADVEAFFIAWEAGASTADVNLDGGVDGGDVETFFIAWEAGGCG